MARSWQDREVGVLGTCPHGCSQTSYLPHLQLPDSSVGTPLQRLQGGLQLPPLPLGHHSGVHSLGPEAGPHRCPPAEPHPLRQGPAGLEGDHTHHTPPCTDDKLGQLESRRNAGRLEECGEAWGRAQGQETGVTWGCSSTWGWPSHR